MQSHIILRSKDPAALAAAWDIAFKQDDDGLIQTFKTGHASRLMMLVLQGVNKEGNDPYDYDVDHPSFIAGRIEDALTNANISVRPGVRRMRAYGSVPTLTITPAP